MFKLIKILISLNLIWLWVGCGSTNSKPLSIEFSSDSSKIIIKNINEAGLFQIKSNLKADTAYQKLVSVLQTPAEDDSTSMEIEWPGKLDIIGDSLLFTPEKPFDKGKLYIVEAMLNVQFAKSEEIVKSDVGHTLKSQQKILKR
ncbi:MAG: hypothetical protein EOP00_20070 [Pedobacter sp.]|nr:MAG: hypothetical protein EOP00_20070 [Pedobacter sp.]